MTKFFSPSTQGFYCNKVHTFIPEDAIEISDATHMSLLIGQSKGQSIHVRDGAVYLEDRSIELTRKEYLSKLEQDLHRYVFIEHGYPIPTQTTLQIIALSSDSSKDTKEKCHSVLRWIQRDVLTYYFKKRELIKSSHEPSLETWDFHNECNPSAPGVKLSDIVKMI